MEEPRKTIVIMNAARGFGPELITFFCKEGHRVKACVKHAGEVKEVGNRWRGATVEVLDLRDDAAVAAWLKGVPAPDFVVCAMAVAPEVAAPGPDPGNEAHFKRPRAWEAPAEDFDACLDGNVKGAASALRHLFARVSECPYKCAFVALVSGRGRSVSGRHVAYCASEWAVEGLVSSAAAALVAPLAAVTVQTGVLLSEMGDVDKVRWAETAGPFLLSLSYEESGCCLTVPGFSAGRNAKRPRASQEAGGQARQQ